MRRIMPLELEASSSGTKAIDTLSDELLLMSLPLAEASAGMTPRPRTCRGWAARGCDRRAGWIGVLRHLLCATQGAPRTSIVCNVGD